LQTLSHGFQERSTDSNARVQQGSYVCDQLRDRKRRSDKFILVRGRIRPKVEARETRAIAIETVMYGNAEIAGLRPSVCNPCR